MTLSRLRLYLYNLPGRLNLSQKGLFLVSVPLLFEIVLVAALLSTIIQSDQEMQRAARAKKIVEQLHVVDGLYVEMSVWLCKYGYTLNDDFRVDFERARKDYEQSLQQLALLVNNDESGRSFLRSIYQPHAELVKLMDQGVDLVSMGLVSEITPLLLRQRQINEQMQELESDYLNLTEMIAVRSPELIRQESLRLQSVLVLAMSVNLFASIGLALVFSKSISQRLLVVYQNAIRFSSGQPLLPQHNFGSDEIANVDNVFRSMAAAVSESRRRERAAADSAAELICSLDERLMFVAANQALLTVSNCSQMEMSSKSLFDLLVPDDRSIAVEAMKSAQASLESVFEGRIVNRFGRTDEFQWSVLWSAGEKAYFCVARNISEQKQLERTKREFVSMVSHDLRSPLTSMSIGLEALEQRFVGNLGESGLTLVTQAQDQVRALLQLVNDLLAVERVESNPTGSLTGIQEEGRS